MGILVQALPENARQRLPNEQFLCVLQCGPICCQAKTQFVSNISDGQGLPECKVIECHALRSTAGANLCEYASAIPEARLLV